MTCTCLGVIGRDPHCARHGDAVRAAESRLAAACDALSDDLWTDVTGAMAQRNDEFCCSQSESLEGKKEVALIAELVDAVRAWRGSR